MHSARRRKRVANSLTPPRFYEVIELVVRLFLAQIAALLERLVPQNCKSFGCWKLPVTSINDTFDYTTTLKHFLQVRFPATWWTSDSADGTSDGEDERGDLLKTLSLSSSSIGSCALQC